MICKVLSGCFLFSFLFAESFAQNLVPNGGFEESIIATNGHADFSNVRYWFNPSDQPKGKNAGTPDHMTLLPNAGTALHSFRPFEGNSCAGIITYLQREGNFREYISVALAEPLEAGEEYQLEFFVSSGYKSTYGNIGSSGLGCWFSEERPAQYRYRPLMVEPQWKQKNILFAFEWQKITVNFKAEKTYRYLTIGNFQPDETTYLQYYRFDIDPQAYVFIDEVSLRKASTLPEVSEVAATVQQAVVTEMKEPNQPALQPEKPRLPFRTVEVQHRFKGKGKTVKIKIWDDRGEDGDIVTLFFNGKEILSDYLLTNRKKSLSVTVMPGQENLLVLFAHNLGKQPPNTAAFELKDGGKKATFRIYSDLGKSGAISIE